MKSIIYRGGIAKFYVPSNWVEQYEPEGGGAFFENKPDTGTLRVNAIDLDKPRDDIAATAYDFLSAISKSYTNTIRLLPNGVAVARSEQRQVENDERLLLYTWQVGVCVTPMHFRLIIFTYTILEKQELDQNVQRDIAMLDQSISKGDYPALKGISGIF